MAEGPGGANMSGFDPTRCTCGDYVKAPCPIHETAAFELVKKRVEESHTARAAEAARVPEVWAMAERLSRGGHSAPRNAAAIYNELISAYNTGRAAADLRKG